MVCLGFKPWTAEWKVRMNPLSFLGTFYNLINFIKHQVLLMVLKMSRIGALGIVAN